MTMSTPREDGFAMPAEWAPHQACLMEWPTLTRAEAWGELFEDAKRDYATVARAIAAFEPVIMVADPAQAGEARDHCGAGIEILPVPIDDSWMRDNGPIFVADSQGRLALVHFRFNSWGGRYLPYDRDALVPAAGAADARGRRLEVIEVDCPSPGGISYLNFYLPNGGVVVPVAGAPEDEAAVAQIAAVFGDREIVAVPGRTLNEGGGGPHCITQQIPAGTMVSPR